VVSGYKTELNDLKNNSSSEQYLIETRESLQIGRKISKGEGGESSYSGQQ